MHGTSLTAFFLVMALIASCGCMGFAVKSPAQQSEATARQTELLTRAPEPIVATTETTLVQIQQPDPYPAALHLKQIFNFSSGKTASEGTVYRYWLNDTYQLFDPRETRYVTKHPAVGNRYLILFVSTVNRGTARNLPVKAANVMVHYNGMTYYPDPTHVLPKTQKNVDSPAEIIRIGEIEFLHKFHGSEYVEDFGYSHGAELAYLTPGESNAIDGYIVYEVPASLAPEKTYVEIVFNSQDVAVWKLA